MTELDTFKRRLGYQLVADQDTLTGNGSTKTVQLRHENVSEVQVYRENDLQPESGYTVDAVPGVITFDTAPGDNVVGTIF